MMKLDNFIGMMTDIFNNKNKLIFRMENEKKKHNHSI